MVFTESSTSVLASQYLLLNNIDLLNGFPLDAPDGLITAPSYSFERNSATGISLLSDNLTFGVNGSPSLAVSMDGNVAVCGGAPTHYGATTPGERVLFINNVTTVPTGTTESGGLIYVNGSSLVFKDSSGAATSLTSRDGDVNSSGTIVTNSIAVYSGVSGKIIKSAPVLTTASQTLLSSDGTLANAAYSFNADANTGLFLASAGNLQLDVGATALLGFSSTVNVLLKLSMPDGLTSAPGLSFSSVINSGVWLSGNELGVACGGVTSLVVEDVGGAVPNVTLCGPTPTNYGVVTPGEGVVFMNEASVVPSGVPNSGFGGILYVSGPDLFYLNSGGTTLNLLTGLEEVSGTTTLNGIVRYDGTTGKIVQNTSLRTILGNGQWLGPAGSSGTPAYRFNAGPAAGLFSPGVSSLSLVMASVQLTVGTTVSLINAQMLTSDGTQAVPAYAFTNATSSGFYKRSSTGLGFSCAGSETLVLEASNNVTLCGLGNDLNYGSGTETLFLHNLVSDPSGNPNNGGFLYISGDTVCFKNSNGTVVNISDTLIGPVGATDNAATIFNGTTGALVQNSGVIISDAAGVQLGAGSVSNSALSFTADADSGVYRSGTVLFLASAGDNKVQLDGSNVTFFEPTLVSDGAVATPSYTFTGDLNTGLYVPVANQVALTVKGVLGVSVSSTKVGLTGTGAASGGDQVVFVEERTVAPVGVLSSGAVLYVSTNDFIVHDDSGANHTLTGGSNIVGPSGTVTDTSLAYWSGTSGDTLSSVSGVTCNGTRLFATRYEFGASDVYAELSGSALLFVHNAGTATTTISTAGVVVSNAQIVCNSLRVGGASGMNVSLVGSTIIFNHLNAAGTTTWQSNGSTIMSTSALNITTPNKVQFVTGTETLQIGYRSGTVYSLDSITSGGSAKSIAFPRAGTVRLRAATTGSVLTNTAIVPTGSIINTAGAFLNASGTIAAPSYSFRTLTTSGFMYDDATSSVGLVVAGALAAVAAPAGATVNLAFSTTTFPTTYNGGERLVYLGRNISLPTVNTSAGAYIYTETSNDDVRYEVDITNANVNCYLNATSKRARITLGTTAISDNSATNLDGLTWTVVDASGISGTTTGAMSIDNAESTVMVTLQANWEANATGYRSISVTTGLVHTVLATDTVTPISGVSTSHSFSCIRRLSALETTLQFAAQVYQNSGGDLNVDLIMMIVRLN